MTTHLYARNAQSPAGIWLHKTEGPFTLAASERWWVFTLLLEILSRHTVCCLHLLRDLRTNLYELRSSQWWQRSSELLAVSEPAASFSQKVPTEFCRHSRQKTFWTLEFVRSRNGDTVCSQQSRKCCDWLLGSTLKETPTNRVPLLRTWTPPRRTEEGWPVSTFPQQSVRLATEKKLLRFRQSEEERRGFTEKKRSSPTGSKCLLRRRKCFPEGGVGS